MGANRRFDAVKADDDIPRKVRAIIEVGSGASGVLRHRDTAFAEMRDALRQMGHDRIQEVGTVYRGLANARR